ncbi:MAG: dTDP-4-dehydrorhamnose 3,5-epimerase [Gemmatimonadota bacterium]|nr:dTDP-4-dehydrorhamnose 3,5-epimerase [Gemmatimonadota bacterium]
MILTETELSGAWVIEPERLSDERGFFARTFDADLFAAHGLCTYFPQCSVSFNARAGTLRGMHWQAAPHGEAKLIRCTMGAIHDVLLDFRPESPSFLHWIAVELSAENRRMLYAPEGVAHGFQTLAGKSEVFYQISAEYHPASVRGVRWDDPAFGIRWPPADQRTIAERDRGFPDFVP